MKQGRLSFSTKRKDRAGEPENVVVVEDSPEKPPPKKVCRESPAECEATVEEKAPEASLPNSKETPESSTKNDEGTPTVEEAEAPGNESKEAQVPAERSEERVEAVNSDPKSDTEQDRKSDGGDSAEVMDVSLAESSMLDSTIDSAVDESDNNEKSDATTPTAPKRARLSKTEAAYRSLKEKKDRELRQKEKDERSKQRQEERERREKERKELKDRKEKERLEKERKKEEERLEREKKKEEERILKEKERIEKEKKKEEERLLREKERVEKEKKKEEERLLREKERLEKEKEKEEKEKLRKEKEDERRRKEEEKQRELEEESAKKEKAKQAFMSFFVKRPSASGTDARGTGAKDPATPSGDSGNDDDSNRAEMAVKFRPFQLKKDMKLAQIVSDVAKNRFDKGLLESKLQEQAANSDNLYLKLLRRGSYKPIKSEKPLNKLDNQEPEDQDVIVVSRFNEGDDESTGGRMRAKFLHFCENYRPAYYGTWRKKCSQITGRNPFNKYSDFDYTVDSDDEWEEGEGESLAGTDDEKEEKEEAEEDYEEDDFLVPHGYLSESEEDEEDDQPMDPEALKARIAARQEEFKADRKAGLQKKKIVAVCALGPDGVALHEEIKVLSQFKAVLMVATGLQPSWERADELIINNKDAEPAVLTGKALELFCRTAHGFQGNTRALYDTFLQKWKGVSDVRVNTKSLRMTLTTHCKKSKALNALVLDSQLVEKFGLETLETEAPTDGTSTQQPSKFLPDDVIPELIKVTQGNIKTSQIIEDFLALMTDRKFGKAQVKRTLGNIGEFNPTQRCWLVKDEILKEHGLEELKIEKTAKKDAKDDKPGKGKDSNKSKESGDDPKSSNKENDDSRESTKNSVADSPRVDATANADNVTPKHVSIKSFFTPKTKTATTPNSSRASKVNSPKTLASIGAKGSSTPETVPKSASSDKATVSTGKVSSVDTPKAKKRVQLTTLSRTPTMKEDNKSQAVLDKDDIILIDESN